MKPQVILAAVSVIWVCGACSSDSPERVSNRTFVIERIVLDGEPVQLDGDDQHLRIEFGPTRVELQTPCSPISGDYAVEDHRLVLDGGTSQGGWDDCTLATFDQMQGMGKILANEPNLTVSDRTLTLVRGNSSIKAVERA